MPPPKVGREVGLAVLRPKVVIYGQPEMFVKEGSVGLIKCKMENIVEPVSWVAWLLNDKVSTFFHFEILFKI